MSVSKKKRKRASRAEVTAASAADVPWLTVRGARHNNLKNIDVSFPLGRFICVTGVSGSGKSSLVNDILREELTRVLNGAEKVRPGDHDAIDGSEHLDKVIDIDQSPIGRTPRSNPATYIKVFDEIRRWYAKLPDSKVRGYAPGRFSFNVSSGERGGGRCDACEGNGQMRVEMDFLADVWTPCPVCEGRRFNHETLQVHYRGKSIFDVLDMDVQEALTHFDAIPKIKAMLSTLHDVGLDYLKLGQSSTTLSGGEAQRIKLARELVKRSTGRTLYLLDEPTTGLHFDDIRRLLAVLHGFVDAGNTVIVIEHNLDVIKTADWVIDLGPDGGDGGGEVVVAGTPEDVTACQRSYTGASLREFLPTHQKAKKAKASAVKMKARGKPSRNGRGRGDAHRSTLQTKSDDGILVVGAREHNLKDITVCVPRGEMTVCSGVSGSGKTSFAIDTVYVEGQRRYVESLSAYARQFLGQFQKPKVDHVYGLSPAIAIEQKSAGHSPRSTVGTVTEIYDYMRVLWARVGQPHCPRCNVPIGRQSSEEIVDRIVTLPEGTRLLLCAPIERGAGETWATLLARCRSQGYVRARIDGKVTDLDLLTPSQGGKKRRNVSGPRISEKRKHTVELVIDRIIVRSKSRRRIADSVEHCLALGKGVLLAVVIAEQPQSMSDEPRTKRGEPRANAGEPRASARAAIQQQTTVRSRTVTTQNDSDADHHRKTTNHSPRKSARAEARGSSVPIRGSSAPARGSSVSADRVLRFSQHLACNRCGRSYEELTPHHFSFNSHLGWCRRCEGLGRQRGTSIDAIILHPHRSILDGAVVGWQSIPGRPLLGAIIKSLARAIGFDPSTPYRELSESHRHALLFGLPDRWVTVENTPADTALRFQWKGFFPAIEEATKKSWKYRRNMQTWVTDVPCQACDGGRIQPQSRAVRLSGKSITDVCSMTLSDATNFFKTLRLDRRDARIAGELLHEIKSRLRFLVDVGLGYLALGRAAPTLSGGESQRIRLASQIGSGLTGVLYVLDEPTIGLHPRDNRRLIGALHKLRDLGNTLLMVEHDAEILKAANHLIDFGPTAGAAGGHVMGHGSPAALKRNKSSLTGRYLAGKEAIAVPTNRRAIDDIADPAYDSYVYDDSLTMTDEPRASADELRAGAEEPRASARAAIRQQTTVRSWTVTAQNDSAADHHGKTTNHSPRKSAWAEARGSSAFVGGSSAVARGSPADDVRPALTVVGARQNNLRAINVAFPLGRFICVTGVSGSGKSSLVTEILYPALASRLHRARLTAGTHDQICGIEFVDKVINVDQQPIGLSPSSNPATYTGVFDLIRAVFARLPDSKVRGFTINRFSFNRPGGRCDNCDGLGQVCHEMHFLPDVWVTCETCGGRRYHRDILEIRYKGQNIADVLNMSVRQAAEHFANIPKLRRLLTTLDDVGLGYLQLGQSAPTLSGGEAQRVKLAAELGRPNTGKTLYILDEPTTGLHFDDLRKLLDVLHRLVDLGNTVICIEHNLDIIKTADWVIDLGPEAGDEGGTIVAQGTPEHLANVRASHTGRLLKAVLAAGPRQLRPVYDAQKAAEDALAQSNRLRLDDHSAGAIKMPWQRDGQKWHTQLRTSRDHQKIEWQGAALSYVIDQIERLGRAKLLSTDWNDRARVEVTAKSLSGLSQSAIPWFLHALTGGRWLLDLSFRVPKNAISRRQLLGWIKLKTLDERDDVQAYGRDPRVQLRPAIGQMDQIRLLVHDKKEISTPGFRSFLKAAMSVYLSHVEKLAAGAETAEPWKADGKAWHLSQKSIAPKQPRQWQSLALVTLLGMVQKIAPTIETRWNRKVFVELLSPSGRRAARIITNQGRALRVDLYVPRGRFTPTQVEHLGFDQAFSKNGTTGPELCFWFRSADEIDRQELKTVLLAASADNEIYDPSVG